MYLFHYFFILCLSIGNHIDTRADSTQKVSFQEIQSDFLGLPIGEKIMYTQYLNNIPLKEIGYSSSRGSRLQLYEEVIPHLRLLTGLAASYDIKLVVVSAHRNHTLQTYIYRKWGVTQAEPPGFSEHQIGTTVDFQQVTENSKAFLWLLEFGIPMGWVPTYYFRDQSTIVQEPWHWRYVGNKASKVFYMKWKFQIDQKKKQLNKKYSMD